jgi:hypothetical protein
MSSIAPLRLKDFSQIESARDVNNLEQRVLNTFADCVLAHFYVADLLSCHVMQPFDARFIVIVSRRGGLSISDVVTAGSNTVGEIANTHHQF